MRLCSRFSRRRGSRERRRLNVVRRLRVRTLRGLGHVCRRSPKVSVIRTGVARPKRPHAERADYFAEAFMSSIGSLGMIGSLAATPLAQKSSDVDTAKAEAGNQQRAADANQRADSAAGI